MLSVNNQDYFVTGASLKGWIEVARWNYQAGRLYRDGESRPAPSLVWRVEFQTAPSSLTAGQVAALTEEYGGNDVVPRPEIAALPVHAKFGHARHPSWRELEGVVIDAPGEAEWEAYMGNDGDIFGRCVQNVARFGARRRGACFELGWEGVCTRFLMEDGHYPFAVSATVCFEGIGMTVQRVADADRLFSAFYDPAEYRKEVVSWAATKGEEGSEAEEAWVNVWYRPPSD